MTKLQTINVVFEVIRIQTMSSGAIRYVFETSENELDVMRDIAECQNRGILLDSIMVPTKTPQRKNQTELNGETKQETKGANVSVARRRLAKRRTK